MRYIHPVTSASDSGPDRTAEPDDPLAIGPPPSGRRFSANRRVRMTDVDRQGRLRLDAIARFAQDVASDDSVDAALHPEDEIAWVVRRTAIEVRGPAVYREPLTITTWCSGVGSRWAERRTSMIGAETARAEVVSLWVSLDPESGVPSRLGPEFTELYAEAAQGRQVRARLTLSTEVPPDAEWRDYPIRRTDIDPLGHMNNSATWAIIEEFGGASIERAVRVELDHRSAIEPDAPARVATAPVDGAAMIWILSGDELAAVARVTNP